MFFFFKDTATTEIYTLSLHDALPIYVEAAAVGANQVLAHPGRVIRGADADEEQSLAGGYPGGELVQDRKSTRLNSSHANISYAVFCLKKNQRTARYYDVTISRASRRS